MQIYFLLVIVILMAALFGATYYYLSIIGLEIKDISRLLMKLLGVCESIKSKIQK